MAVVRFQGPLGQWYARVAQADHLPGYCHGARVPGGPGSLTDASPGPQAKVPFAIHCTPEAAERGTCWPVCANGDPIVMDAHCHAPWTCWVDQDELAARKPVQPDLTAEHTGLGRELFAVLRQALAGAEQGAKRPAQP